MAILPLLVFSIVSAVLFAREERRIFQRGATERTRALLTAVDTELKRSVAALEVLAASANLDSEDIGPFEREAQHVLTSRPEWLNIHLAPPSGNQVMNLLRPGETHLHHVVDAESFEEVVFTGRPKIGNLFREPVMGRQVFPVRVPVRRDGELRYVLTALVEPRHVHELLLRQKLPADWVGVVLDAKQNIVARTIGPELVGHPASDSLRAALARGNEGWFQGSTVEGWPVYTPFNRSDYSGWSLAMGIPTQTVEASLQRTLVWLGILGALLLGSGFLLAWLLAGRNVRSLEQMAAMAEDLGLGRAPAPSRPAEKAGSRVAEVENLRRAFQSAADLIRARSEERDRVEDSLRRAQGQLRESEKRKDQFLAMLGHELRNPLSVIGTAVELLRNSPEEESGSAGPRAMIERQVSHMTELLDDLLDVSRIAEGRIHLERQPCDLVALVRATVEDHRALCEGGDLTLEVRLPDAPLWVTADRTRLSQALGNVLQNACKYTDPGGTVSVHVRAEVSGETAVIEVRDTGVGMEPEILEHAFEAFSQADRTLDRSRGGLGLGLALVQGLIALHAGTVEAHSEGAGKGCRVSIRLPLETARPVASDRIASDPASVATSPRRRVLLIEDNEDAARSLDLYLTRLGHTVEVARSGPEGIEVAQRFRPEVVLCDIGLPGLDGYDVARALRREDWRIGCLVALSGYGQDGDRRRAQAAGFDGHLTKPVDLDALQRIVAKACPAP